MTSPFDSTGAPLAERLATGFAKIGLALKTASRREGGKRGLSPLQGQALAAIRAEGGVIQAGALARVLGVSAATASESVSVLIEKGFVERRTREDDRRVADLVLTSTGRREAARAADWPDFLSEVIDDLPEAEQAVMMRAVVRMIRTLQEKGRIPVSKMCVTCTHFRPHAHSDSERPHHCAFVDAPMADRDLRLECPDHAQTGKDEAERTWKLFVLK